MHGAAGTHLELLGGYSSQLCAQGALQVVLREDCAVLRVKLRPCQTELHSWQMPELQPKSTLSSLSIVCVVYSSVFSPPLKND